MLRTGQLLHPASTPASRPKPGASLPGTLASPRTGLAPAGCRELVARLRHDHSFALRRPSCWTHVDPGYAGKTMTITLFDPGEGATAIQILQPDGTPASFTYQTDDTNAEDGCPNAVAPNSCAPYVSDDGQDPPDPNKPVTCICDLARSPGPEPARTDQHLEVQRPLPGDPGPYHQQRGHADGQRWLVQGGVRFFSCVVGVRPDDVERVTAGPGSDIELNPDSEDPPRAKTFSSEANSRSWNLDVVVEHGGTETFG